MMINPLPNDIIPKPKNESCTAVNTLQFSKIYVEDVLFSFIS